MPALTLALTDLQIDANRGSASKEAGGVTAEYVAMQHARRGGRGILVSCRYVPFWSLLSAAIEARYDLFPHFPCWQGIWWLHYAGTDTACVEAVVCTSRKWQATWWPGRTSRISGSSCEQRAKE